MPLISNIAQLQMSSAKVPFLEVWELVGEIIFNSKQSQEPISSQARKMHLSRSTHFTHKECKYQFQFITIHILWCNEKDFINRMKDF